MELTSISVHETFLRAKDMLRSRVFYPALGRKTVGEECRSIYLENAYSILHSEKDMLLERSLDLDFGEVTPISSEKMYVETGFRPGGPVEMRRTWKYTDLKPRVYYARGGSVLSSSLYIQEVVNILVDLFPEVHRNNRFNPSYNVPTADHLVILYDYSAFTSCLNEVPAFVDGMAEFFSDVDITVFDTREGHIQINLGDVFREYNKSCNVSAEFVCHRDLGLPEERFQHHCGMLGVPGNIFIATLLHGIHTRFISGVDRSRCVGDDASIQVVNTSPANFQDDVDYAFYLIESLGNISHDKLVLFPYGAEGTSTAYHFLKRPIFRVDQILVQNDSLVLPRLDLVFDISDEFHPIAPNSGKASVIFTQLRRLITSLTSLRISEFDQTFDNPVVRLIFHIRSILLKEDPEGEHGIRRTVGHPYSIPPLQLFGSVTFEEWLKEDIGWYEHIRVPKRSFASSEIEYPYSIGYRFESTATPELSLLFKLGYIDCVSLFEDISPSTSGGLFRSYFDLPLYKRVNEYKILKEIPSIYTLQ